MTMAIKSVSNAPRAAAPFGWSLCPAAALKTSAPTMCQKKLLLQGWAKLQHPTPRWAMAHTGAVCRLPTASTAQLWGQQPLPVQAQVLRWPPQHCCGKQVLAQHVDATPTLLS